MMPNMDLLNKPEELDKCMPWSDTIQSAFKLTLTLKSKL